MGLTAGAYLSGVVGLAATAAALLYASHALRARFLPHWFGAPARLAEITGAIALLLWISELLGLIGLLEEIPLLLVSVVLGLAVGIWAAGGLTAFRRVTGPAGTSLDVSSAQVITLLAVLGTLFTLWALPTLDSIHGGMYGFDTQWYHMPFSVQFAQTGGIWPLNFTAPVFLNWFYPANSELLHTTGILAFGRDLLSPAVNMGWLGFSLLAAWCVGRPWGVPGWSALGAGVVLGAAVFADQAGDARNDIVSLGLVFASSALLATEFGGFKPKAVRVGPALVIAGIAAGLAAGTRLTALAPLAALTVGVIALAPRGERVRVGAAWLAPVFAAGGLWYVRNFISSGNPLPWIDSIGPISLPGPGAQELGGREPFAVIHYLTDADIWSDWFFPALDDRLGIVWPAVLAAAALGSILAVVNGRGVLRVHGAMVIVAGLAYIVTPVTASGAEGFPLGFESNLRYVTTPLALGLALLPTALTLARGRPFGVRWSSLAAGVLALLFVSVLADDERWPTVYLKAALAIGIGVAAIAAITFAVRAGRLACERHRIPLAVGLAACAAVGVAYGYSLQRDYLEERYANPAEILPNPGLATAFVWARDLTDSRVGVTIQRQLPFAGTDLSNRVEFVGVHEEQAGFRRATSCAEWREAVNAGQFDYLVTAVDRAAPGSTFSPKEEIWTRGDPAAVAIAEDGPATVWELSGPLDPAACP